jgi:hypothetical protein
LECRSGTWRTRIRDHKADSTSGVERLEHDPRGGDQCKDSQANHDSPSQLAMRVSTDHGAISSIAN